MVRGYQRLFVAAHFLVWLCWSGCQGGWTGEQSPRTGPKILFEVSGAFRLARYALAESLAWAAWSDPDRFGLTQTDRHRALDAVVLARIQRGLSRDPRTERLARLALSTADVQQHPEASDSHLQLGILLAKQGRYAPAESLLQSVLRARREIRPSGPEVGEACYRLANLARDMGRRSRAMELYREALSLQRAPLGGEDVTVARTKDDLGGLLLERGQEREAEGLIRNALEMRRKSLSTEHPDVAKSLDHLGWVEARRGHWSKARSLFENARRTRARVLGREHAEFATSLDNLGRVAEEESRWGVALSFYRDALRIRIARLGPAHPDVATSWINVADVLASVDSLAQARNAANNALAIREKVFGMKHPFVALSLGDLAVVDAQEGELESARMRLVKATMILDGLGPDWSAERAALLINLGSILTDLGTYEQAHRALLRARDLAGSNAGGHVDLFAAAETALGLLERRIGDFESSSRRLEHALQLNRHLHTGNHPEVSAAMNNLAGCRQLLGQRTGARTLYEQAIRMDDALHGGVHPSIATGRMNLGLLLAEMGNHGRAVKELRTSLDIHLRTLGPWHPGTGLIVHNLAEVELLAGQPDSALAHFRLALSVREKSLGSEHILVGQSRLGIGRACAARGDWRGAFNEALESERIGRAHQGAISRGLLEDLALRHRDIRIRGIDLALAALPNLRDENGAAVVQAWDAVIRDRGVVQDAVAARYALVHSPTTPKQRTIRDSLEKATSRLAVAVLWAERSARHEGLLEIEASRHAVDRLEAELHELIPGAATRWRSRDPGFASVQRSAPKGSALVAYILYRGNTGDQDARYAAFVMPGERGRPRFVPIGPAAEINSLIVRWRQEAEDSYWTPASGTGVESGLRLREAVWDPLEPLIRSASRVWIVPDGLLNLVNFYGLSLPEGRFLIERSPTLQILATERDLLRIRDRTILGRGMLAVGDVAFSGAKSAGDGRARARPGEGLLEFGTTRRFEPLDGSRRELSEIEQVWSKTKATRSRGTLRILRGGEASEARFKREVQSGYRTLHVATHGFFLGQETRSWEPRLTNDMAVRRALDAPMLCSGIALAGANDRSLQPGGEDGLLTAAELATLDLSSVDWVVLSACNTGVGRVVAGEGVFGLRRAIVLAGAGGYVMSLWPVDDSETVQWMSALYRARLQRGFSAAEAVRAASLERLKLRRKAQVSVSPALWAGFVGGGVN